MFATAETFKEKLQLPKHSATRGTGPSDETLKTSYRAIYRVNVHTLKNSNYGEEYCMCLMISSSKIFLILNFNFLHHNM